MENGEAINLCHTQKEKLKFKELFIDILPPNYKLFYHKQANSYSIYIAQNPIPVIEVSTNIDSVIGFINFAIVPDDSEKIIQYMQSNMPKVGIGHYLLLIAATIAVINSIEKILLDDDSDMARQGSVYERIGCKYIDNTLGSNEPEMECNPSVMLDQYQIFRDRYVNTNKFFVNSVTAVDDAVKDVTFSRNKTTQRKITKKQRR